MFGLLVQYDLHTLHETGFLVKPIVAGRAGKRLHQANHGQVGGAAFYLVALG